MTRTLLAFLIIQQCYQEVNPADILWLSPRIPKYHLFQWVINEAGIRQYYIHLFLTEEMRNDRMNRIVRTITIVGAGALSRYKLR